jgi:hypothetical protein
LINREPVANYGCSPQPDHPTPTVVFSAITTVTSTSESVRLEGGKFAEVWDLADMDAVMRQIRQGEAPLTAPADEAGTADS